MMSSLQFMKNAYGFGLHPVAGKKGKMMERRILKDFQIGIVEGIVSDAVKATTEVKDVFSTIAKAIGSKSTG